MISWRSSPQNRPPGLPTCILRAHGVHAQKERKASWALCALHFTFKFTFFFRFTSIFGFLGGVLLLENPKGDNRLDLLKLKSVVTSVFGVKDSELALFLGESGVQKGESYPWPLTQAECVNQSGSSAVPACAYGRKNTILLRRWKLPLFSHLLARCRILSFTDFAGVFELA